MKKTLIYAMLVLEIAVSLVTGTLATYSKTLIPIEGFVKAKQYYIGTNETFYPMIKLAPTESKDWNFTVVNYIGDEVTEVDMDMSIMIELEAVEDRIAIDGLTVALYNEGVQIGNSIVKEGSATFQFPTAFIANIKADKAFTLKAEWVNGEVSDTIDTQNADMLSTSRFRVSITGTQHISPN